MSIHVTKNMDNLWSLRIAGREECLYLNKIYERVVIEAGIYSLENGQDIFIHKNNGKIKEVLRFTDIT